MNPLRGQRAPIILIIISALAIFSSPLTHRGLAYAANFNIGDTIEVYNANPSGLLVLGPTPCGAIIDGKFDGARGVVLSGPSFCSGYNRWKIRWSDNGTEGWSAENWLRLVPPQITVGPTSLDFGQVAVNSCGTGSFAIQHVLGTGPASGTVGVSGSPFSIFSGSSFSVSNGSSATVTVQFCPTSAGNFSGTATVSSSATFTGTNTVVLSGTGVQNPILNVLDNSLGFGTINVGSSADQAFTIRNDGGGTLTGSVVSVSPNPPFSLVGGGSFTLGAGQGQQVTIRFTPQSIGSFTGNVSVSSNGGSDNVSLAGTGQIVGPTDTITITVGPTATPNPVSSGGQVQVSVSASDSLGHSLGYAWTGSGGSFSNPSSASTTWTAPPNTTGTTQSYTLSMTVTDLQGSAASQTRSLTVQVSPSSAPQVTLGPTSLNFWSVHVGTCSQGSFAIQHVLGTGPASGTVSASPNPPFSILSGSPFSASNGAGPLVTVQFCPTSVGNFTGSAVVSSPGTTFTNTNTVALTGSGEQTSGAIQVNATLNSSPWSGNVNYTLSGPTTITGNTVPANFSSRPPGTYTLTHSSGGPSSATLANITPSATQTLSNGGSITYTLNFTADTVTITTGPSGTPNPVTSGGTVNLSAVATDSLNHTLTYSWSALCSGLPSNGTFSNTSLQNPTWAAPTNTTGTAKTCTLTVTASDGGFGHSDTKSFTQTVNSENQQTGVLAVTVKRSDTNAPLSGATVSLSGGPSSPAPQPTGADGTTTFANLQPGTYTATASLSGFQTNNAQATVSANTTTPVTIPLTPIGPSTVDLTILVRNANTLAPIGNATVSISGPTPRSGVTDGNGLVLFSGITAGNYTVIASASGFSQSSHSIAAIGAPSIQDEIRLTPTGPQTGILNVATTPVNGDIFVNGTLYGTGSIRREVAPGSYTVSFGAVSGYTTPAPQSVNITAGEERILVATYERIVLPKVNLSSPTNGATGQPITPTFVWSGVEGANLYWLMVAKDPSDFPTDTNATSCPSCIISGRTGSTSHTLPHTFPIEGRSGRLSVNTTYFWKVQAWNTNGAKGDYSDTFRFTTEAPESKPPEREETSLPSVEPTSLPSGAIFIVHGVAVDGSMWPKDIAEHICAKLGAPIEGVVEADKIVRLCRGTGNGFTWDVLVNDWRSKAHKAPRQGEALHHAQDKGEALGEELFRRLWLDKADPNMLPYQHIHFIAHSAGAMLIHSATKTLIEKWDELSDPGARPRIHETFLDAYYYWGRGWFVKPKYGEKADWADNYVDTRNLWKPIRDSTEHFLENAFNIDVTPDGDFPCEVDDGIDAFCRHSRPVRFYGRSLGISEWENHKDNNDYNKIDPIESDAGMGYHLSVEAGRSMEHLKLHFKNTTCKVVGSSCQVVSTVPAHSTVYYIPGVAQDVVVEALTAAVDLVQGVGTTIYNKVTMGLAWATSLVPQQILAVRESTTSGATTEEPSYLVVNVTTASPVNTLRFNWRFHEAGEGLLRVFVGGNLVRQIDQRHVTPSLLETEEIYIGGDGEPLPAGTHRITFRLDGFGANASGAELTDVELGLKAGPPTISTNTLPQGEVGASYTQTLQAEGGMPPYTWSLAGGKKNKLPKGITLSSDGILTGIPSKAKTTSFTVQVTDASGASATQTLSLQIVKGVKLKTKKLPKGMVGTPYSATLQATGGIAPLTFSLVGGTLPPGLTPPDPATGQISGTPTAAGTFNFQVRVASSGGSSNQRSIQIKIK